MGEESFIEMPQPLGLFAHELHSRGKEFLTAFEKLSELGNDDLNYPLYFLLAHSIELLLKSYLAAKGETKDKLSRQLRHNLKNIYNQCKLNLIPDVPDLCLLVACLHEMNKDNDFRYPSGYILEVPKATECLTVARSLAEVVAPAVQNAAIDATLRFASSTRHHRGRKVRWSD
ncbi:MAG: hypothetical protein U1E81_04710 [Xanthobacteraceae bacterium]